MLFFFSFTSILILQICVSRISGTTIAGDCYDGHSATSWRVVASTTRSGWAWDVKRLNFITDEGAVQLSDDCSVIHSGSVSDEKHGGISGYKAENAFSDNPGWWGGRKSHGRFFLGFKCTKLQSVRSVQILQHGTHVADNVEVQRLHGDEWMTVGEARLHKADDLESIELSCATQEILTSTSSELKDSGVPSTSASQILLATTTPIDNFKSAGNCYEHVSHGAMSWRVVASTTGSGWAWDVERLKFITDNGVVQLGDGCSVIHSGSVSDEKHGGISGYEAENAFRNSRQWWGGRKNAGLFYLGFKCTRLQSVRSVEILQHGTHVADNVKVQRLDDDEWITVGDARLNKVDELESMELSCSMPALVKDMRPVDFFPSATTATGADSSSIVHGVVTLSVALTDAANTKEFDARLQIRAHSKFLSDAIADTYGLQTVSILGIDIARRLRAAGITRLLVNFRGVGKIAASVPSTALLHTFQNYFTAYGLQIEGTSMEIIENAPPASNPSHTEEKTKEFYYILLAVGGTLCCALILLVAWLWRNQAKKISIHNEEKEGNHNNVVAIDPTNKPSDDDKMFYAHTNSIKTVSTSCEDSGMDDKMSFAATDSTKSPSSSREDLVLDDVL